MADETVKEYLKLTTKKESLRNTVTDFKVHHTSDVISLSYFTILIFISVGYRENIDEKIMNEFQQSKRLKYDKQGQRQTRSGRKVTYYPYYREIFSSLSEEEDNVSSRKQRAKMGCKGNGILRMYRKLMGVIEVCLS